MTLASGITLPVEGVAEICRKYQVRELSVFGSAARGDLRPDSDIDLLVEFEPDASLGLFEFAAMEEELTTVLGRKVDLVSKRGLKPRVRPHVLRDAIVIYADNLPMPRQVVADILTQEFGEQAPEIEQ